METPVVPMAQTPGKHLPGNDAPLPPFQQDADILALERWQQANCPELAMAYEDWLGDEEALRCRASCS